MNKLFLFVLSWPLLWLGNSLGSQVDRGEDVNIMTTPLDARRLETIINNDDGLTEKDHRVDSCTLVYFNSSYYPGVVFKLMLNNKYGTIQSVYDSQIDTLSRYAHYWISKYVKDMCLEGNPMIIKKDSLDVKKVTDWPRLSITVFNKNGDVVFDKQNLPVTQRDEDYAYQYSQEYKDLIEYVDVLSQNLSERLKEN